MWPFLLFIFIKQSGQTEEEVLNEIFPVFKEKQRFSTGLQAWNIKSKSVSGDVRVAKSAHEESSGNISK